MTVRRDGTEYGISKALHTFMPRSTFIVCIFASRNFPGGGRTSVNKEEKIVARCKCKGKKFCVNDTLFSTTEPGPVDLVVNVGACERGVGQKR